jgi:hypothetical protein
MHPCERWTAGVVSQRPWAAMHAGLRLWAGQRTLPAWGRCAVRLLSGAVGRISVVRAGLPAIQPD